MLPNQHKTLPSAAVEERASRARYTIILFFLGLISYSCSAGANLESQSSTNQNVASESSTATSNSTSTPTPTATETIIPTSTATPTSIPGYVPEGAIRNFGRGEIYALASSPDGTSIAVGSVGGTYILSADYLIDEVFIPNERPSSLVNSVDFSINGEYLLVSSNARGIADSQIYLISTTNWEVEKKLSLAARVSQPRSQAIAKFSPTETLVAILHNGTLSTWNYETGEWQAIFSNPAESFTFDFEFLDNGELIIANGQRVLLLDSTNGAILERYESQFSSNVRAITVSHNSLLLAGYELERLVVLNLADGEILLESKKISINTIYPPDLEFSTDDTTLFLGYRGEIISWDIESGSSSLSLLPYPQRDPPYFFQEIEILPSEYLIASSTLEDITRWNLETTEATAINSSFSNTAGNLTISPDGNLLVIQSALYDLNTGEELFEFPYKQVISGYSVFSTFSSGSNYVGIAAWAEGQIYDTETFEEICEFGGNVPIVWFSPNEEMFAFPTGENFIVRRLSSCNDVNTFWNQSENSNFAVSASWEYVFESTGDELFIYHLQTGDMKFSFPTYGIGATRFVSSEEGRFLAISSNSSDTLVFDLELGEQIGRINSPLFGETPYGRPTPNKIQNNQILTSGSIWDVEQRKNVAIFSTRSHREVTNLAYSLLSPDGATLALLGFDGRPGGSLHLYIVDPWTGETLHDYIGHSGLDFLIFQLAFSPDGRNLITVGNDGSILVWDTSH